MIDYNIVVTLAVLAFTLLIFDAGLGILMKLRLLGKCRVECEDTSE